MNLRAAQVKIIQEYIQSRIERHKELAAKASGPTIEATVTKNMSEAAILELEGVWKTIDYACEFGEPEKEAA